jgi:hypothetical protein
MPQSNKRTACLPSPHHVDLQSHCSALPGSPLLGLCWATALHQIHTPPPPGFPPLRLCRALALCQIHALPGSSPPWPHQIHAPLGPPPLGSPASQALLGLSSTWDDQRHTPPGSPPLRLGTSLAGDNHIPQPTWILAHWVEPGPSSTGFPDNSSTRLLLRPPLESSKCA